MRGVLTMLAATVVATPLAAQPCPPPPEFAGWQRPTPVSAAARLGGERPPATIVAGRAAAVTLEPGNRVAFTGAPGRAGGPVRYAGLLALDVRLPGLYRVALGGPAWVDIVAGGRAVPSVAHGHAPECSPVRKLVDFRLAAGRHVLQLSDARSPSVAVMVVRVRP